MKKHLRIEKLVRYILGEKSGRKYWENMGTGNYDKWKRGKENWDGIRRKSPFQYTLMYHNIICITSKSMYTSLLARSHTIP